MKCFFIWFWQNWFKFREKFLGYPAPLKTVYTTDMPNKFIEKQIYVISENNHLWFICFLCPCGCRTLVQLSLLSNSKPHWTLTEHQDGTISLTPSVWRKDHCRSHYFVRHGYVKWV